MASTSRPPSAHDNDANAMIKQESEEQERDSSALHPLCILCLPREIMDKVFSKLSQVDHKSLRVTCFKFEQILNPLVFRRLCLSKARVDRLAFWNITSTPKVAAHVKELVWFELAEDESVFIETANDAMPPYRGNTARKLRDSIRHDNNHTLPALSAMAASAFWLPSNPKDDNPQREAIQFERNRILHEWFQLFYHALEALPQLDTFTSQPMPAYHVLSRPIDEYKFVAYMFQMDSRCEIQHYQRNDGLFSVLMPAMARLGQTIKHLHWADEAYGEESSIKRIRYRHGLSFRYLKSVDLCLSLPSDTFIRRPRFSGRERTCWSMLGSCLDRVRGLQEISICFEKADPKVGIWALLIALDECLFDQDIQLASLTRLNLRDGPAWRFPLLDVFLARFLARYGPTLRHLSFRRWVVSQHLLHHLSNSQRLRNLDGFKIDNEDFERGASIPESDLLAFVNNKSHKWPLPLGATACKSTIGPGNKFLETPGVCDWANPKFANIPAGMDFCAALVEGTTSSEDKGEGNDNEEDGNNDEDDDFEPSESSDSSDSDFDVDFDVDSGFDSDDEAKPQSKSGNSPGSSEHTGTV